MPKRVMQGVVVSDRSEKTVVVRVDRRVRHPIYKKFITQSKKFMAHDEGNAYRAGDQVRIEESRPLSRRKRWQVICLVTRSGEVEIPEAGRRAGAATANAEA